MVDNIEKGIITHIYLENFVTYDKIVVKPNRYLNVIIGPNGSGKSTIVAAIVLGLGGKPNIIGRALHVGEYVKYGCTKAKIEIHLKNGMRQDVAITRSFTNQGNSTWMIDNKPTNAKAVQEFTASLNIQVNNLCQFLPQDKVQDFSKMDAQALLENTERSVGDPKLLEQHQKLKEYRNKCKQLENDVTSKKRLLGSKTQKHDGLKLTVSTIKQRELIMKNIETLKQKKAWMLYDQMRRKLLEAKKTRDAAARQMQSIDVQLKPMNDAIKKINSEIKTSKSTLSDHNIIMRAKTTKLKTIMDKILDCEKDVKEIEEVCSRKIQAEERRDHDINLAQQQKSKLENDFSLMINEIGSEENLMKQIQIVAANVNEQKNKINKLTNTNTTLKNQEDTSNREMRSLEAQQKSLNIDAQRLELLRQRSMDAYKGVLWLRENRDKFSATVHEPMMLSINAKDTSYAKYLETMIPTRDLIAFTCENKQDMNLLLQYLRNQQKLQVNVVHSDVTKAISMQPNISIENIKKFGFTNYLVSLFEAPSTIMKYLISMYRLNNIPVGTNTVENNIDSIPRAFNCYFSENNAYSVNISKYSNAVSTKISRISGNRILSIVLDKLKLKGLQERLQILRENKDKILIEMREIQDEICKQTEDLDKCRSDRNKYQQNIQSIQALKSRIRIAEDKVKQMEMDRTSIENIKQTCITEIKVIIKKQMELYTEYNSIVKEHFNNVVNNEEIKFAIMLLQKTVMSKENSAEELKHRFAEAEKTFKEYDDEFQPLKRETERLYNEALQLTNNINPEDHAFQSLNKMFEKLPATINDINKELNVAQTKAFCMTKNIDAENILREYEGLQNDIQNLNEFMKTKAIESDEIIKRIEKLKDEWLPPLKQLVEKINENFSSYFSAMDCSGEVTLAHGENIMDFDQYGLKIRVKFRDVDELQELTRHFQSGGERTVTTAIYMIALQELSRVPFRCVDEINQGMDAVNERRVFNLLVKMTGRPGSSQYFLLTPKLLSDLTYAETVTVHCVFNGPVINAQNARFEFDVETYCNQLMSMTDKSDDTTERQRKRHKK